MGSADGMSKYPYIRESRRMLARGARHRAGHRRGLRRPGPRAQLVRGLGRHRLLYGGYPPVRRQRARAHAHAEAVSRFRWARCCRGTRQFPAGGQEPRRHSSDERRVPAASGGMEYRGSRRDDRRALAGARIRCPRRRTCRPTLAARGRADGLVRRSRARTIRPSRRSNLPRCVGSIRCARADLHASPDAPVTRGEAAAALVAYFGKRME